MSIYTRFEKTHKEEATKFATDLAREILEAGMYRGYEIDQAIEVFRKGQVVEFMKTLEGWQVLLSFDGLDVTTHEVAIFCGGDVNEIRLEINRIIDNWLWDRFLVLIEDLQNVCESVKPVGDYIMRAG